ncbi:ribonuclease P protein component [Salinimicrobium gaetbulicola]|uniref:Ribonuclease P protein component n=1 Tax=Salinimicrobium gaetbulicola TaxID=999702 RepID=A0ABW3IIY8_9FLAO
MNESFGKQEKLKSKVLIDKLFAEGKSVKKFPMLLIYLPLSEESENYHKTGVSVPKRNHKKAVDRIKLKRLMREAYRKNKYLVSNSLDSHYAFMFIYIGREIVSYSKIVSSTRELLKSLVEKETK